MQLLGCRAGAPVDRQAPHLHRLRLQRQQRRWLTKTAGAALGRTLHRMWATPKKLGTFLLRPRTAWRQRAASPPPRALGQERAAHGAWQTCAAGWGPQSTFKSNERGRSGADAFCAAAAVLQPRAVNARPQPSGPLRAMPSMVVAGNISPARPPGAWTTAECGKEAKSAPVGDSSRSNTNPPTPMRRRAPSLLFDIVVRRWALRLVWGIRWGLHATACSTTFPAQFPAQRKPCFWE